MRSLFLSHSIRRLAAHAVCVFAVSSTCALASPITFVAEDLGAGPGGPFTNSNAAAASFATAAAGIGTLGLINFESAPLGAFGSLTVAPGVVVSGPTGLSINNVPNFPTAPSVDGFNTTPAGAKYVEESVVGGGNTVTFTFSSPIQFFGVYLTGLQGNFAQDTINFNDGSPQTILALQTGTSGSLGAVNFVGFTDAGKSITSVTINTGTPAGYDFIGVDDVVYQVAASTPVPEPATLTLTALGLAAVARRYRRRRASL